ncbi:MAG: hypothetical protein GXY44_10005 [Phycisphaerales bacterium]|nr:hypothetical protein [Phycisphaerales bacterium]
MINWKTGRASLVACIMAVLCGTLVAADAIDMQARTEELKNQRWGMFICWSFSTFSGRGWTGGVQDIDFFGATEVDTDQWARTAKEAEMGYILFLTKHHDGFCLWDTKTTDRKVTNAPLGRDVLAELKKSCDKYGIKLALYYSEGDWTWPGAVDGKSRREGIGRNPEIKKAQLRELLTEYGPIEYIWFDHAVGDGGLSHVDTIAFCKSLQPGCFVGFNHGVQEGSDIRLGERGRPGPLEDHTAAGPHMKDEPATTYRIAEFTYPIYPQINGKVQWFYTSPQNDHLVIAPGNLYQDYLGAVQYGNIFSISVAPDYRGRLRDVDVTTLRRVGNMIRAKASSELKQGYEADKAFDGDETTRWGAARDARSGWIELDLGNDTEIDRAVVMEIGYPRTKEFAIEYRAGDTWVPLVTGMTISGRRMYEFSPIKARAFRLNILSATDVPTIEEFLVLSPGASPPAGFIEEEQKRARLEWFHEAKYGLFINWGLYSINAGEWQGKVYSGSSEWVMIKAKIPVQEYERLAEQFNPTRFDANEWAQLAVDAGMKYLVFDCKHHDGFAMYRSEVSPFNVYDATPWKRDPFAELRAACDRHGIKLCFYYSHFYDWHAPDGFGNDWDFKPNDEKDIDRYVREKSLPQVSELLTNYGPIGLIWFDMGRDVTPDISKRFVDLVRSIQPNTLINSRVGQGGYHDYRSRGDNEIPNIVTPGAWETAATINRTWGFHKNDNNWKPAEDICFKLVDIVSKGGNYLLNVGPDADGVIPQPSQDILRKVGAWLKVNGEAIYGAERTPFGDELGAFDPERKDDSGRPVFTARTDWRCTTKPGRLYFHIFRWPGSAFELPSGMGPVARAFLLADPARTPLAISDRDGRMVLALPETAPDTLATVVCVELE